MLKSELLLSYNLTKNHNTPIGVGLLDTRGGSCCPRQPAHCFTTAYDRRPALSIFKGPRASYCNLLLGAGIVQNSTNQSAVGTVTPEQAVEVASTHVSGWGEQLLLLTGITIGVLVVFSGLTAHIITQAKALPPAGPETFLDYASLGVACASYAAGFVGTVENWFGIGSGLRRSLEEADKAAAGSATPLQLESAAELAPDIGVSQQLLEILMQSIT